MKYFYLLFCSTSVLYGIYLFALHLFLGDLLFHTDIARDFLLIQDIAVHHKLTLIGPRAGGIPGTFFGPIWLYLNLPVFILSNGNPLAIGYFWLLLFLFGVGVVFYVSKKIFSTTVGLVAITIFIYTILFLAPGFTQSFAPVFLSPILLYTVYLFVEKKKISYLCWSVFLCGLLIQFQPAFGLIASLITFILSFLLVIKRKQIKYLLTWVLMTIPMATYIIFELRHNFLQTRVLFNFIFHHNSLAFAQITFVQLMQNRLGSFLDSINLININTPLTNTFFVFLNVFIVYVWFRSKKNGQRSFILLVYLYLIGFWLITFLFNGTVWDYYYWGLFPLLSITHGSLFFKVNKRVFLVLFIIWTLIMVKNGYNTVTNWENKIYAKDTSSWIVSKKIAEYIYLDANEDFGYYIYSTNNFGYAKRYAMDYIGRTGIYPERGALCQKKHLTYLIYNKTNSDSHTDPVFWKNSEVNIKAKPVMTKVIQSIKVERYELSSKQIKITSDPTMICGIEMR